MIEALPYAASSWTIADANSSVLLQIRTETRDASALACIAN